MPKAALKNFFINIILAFASLSLLILFLELFFFRFVALAPDLPLLDFKNGVVKYKPFQKGVYRVKDEIKASYSINAQGWNSARQSYDIERNAGKYRIAIIGDSYIEALSVNYDESIGEELEKMLGSGRTEVYRFGISGAPMSQYLYMLRKEVLKYRPDLVVVLLVHNDFDESYRMLKGSYGSNFMKLDINGSAVSEIEPKRFVRPWYTFIRESATWRYLAYRELIPYTRIKDILLGNTAEYQGNIAVGSLGENRDMNKITTDYVFSEMKMACDSIGAGLLILIDGDRKAIHSKIDSKELYENGALSLNRLAAESARKKGINFIDLHPIFEADYAKHGKGLVFKYDGHWNAYAHNVAAGVTAGFIRENIPNK